MIRLRKADWLEIGVPHIPGLPHGEHVKWYRWGETLVCVAKEDGLWHISISCPHRYPDWEEIFTAWYDLVPEAGQINGAIILPRKSEYVNIHENCFHVHQLRDAEIPGSIVL